MGNRVLFVDDEPQVLRALRRGLRRQRDKWEISFAVSGEDALTQLDSSEVDVLISDVTMPRLDGIELLERARTTSPDTARFLMSGTMDPKVTQRAVPCAHRFLRKPFDFVQLIALVDDTLSMRELLRNPRVRQAVGSVRALPSAPTMYCQLSAAIQDPFVDLDGIVDIVERDPAMAARILHMVNSAFFDSARDIGTLSDAVRLLGTHTLRDLALVEGVFRRFDDCTAPAGFAMAREQDHAAMCGSLAAALAERKHAGAAYTAGMLHDVGKLLYATEMTDVWGDVLARSTTSDLSLTELETELLGATHAEVGAYLLGLWHIPAPIVAAVLGHHDAPVARDGRVDIATAVRVANGVALGTIDDHVLRELGLLERVNCWRDTA